MWAVKVEVMTTQACHYHTVEGELPLGPTAEAVSFHSVIVMTDQHRGDCIGSDPHCPTDRYGDPFVNTPTRDGIARRGTMFSRAYSPNPVCVPARRCLWTGQKPATNGCPGGNMLYY